MAKNNLFSTRSMAFIAIMAAMICVAAPFAVPLPGGIPISLATFAIYLSGALLGKSRGTLAVVIYILIGAVGLPVFTNFTGGFAKLLGVTGGYIIGYIPCALITGIFADAFAGKKRIWAMPLGMVLGTAALYAFGTVWYMVSTGNSLVVSLLSCVVPFLFGDAVKIVCSTALGIALKDKVLSIMEGKTANTK